MKKQIKLSVTMPLRDYGAFEDLATELGVHIQDEEILHGDIKPKKRRVRGKRIKPTAEIWDAAREYPEDTQTARVQRDLRTRFGDGNVPSKSTIGRIRQGVTPRPERSMNDES